MKRTIFALIFIMLVFCNLNSNSNEWIETKELGKYPSRLYITGFGEGSTIEEAISSAQLVVASQLRVTIKGNITSITKESQINDKISYSDYFEKTTKSVVNEIIPGVEIVKQEKVKEKYYAFAVLKKEKYLTSLKTELDSFSKIISQLITSGSEFVDKGDILNGLDKYFEAQKYISMYYPKIAFYNALSDLPYEINDKINIDKQISDIIKILSYIKFNIDSGDNQKSKIGHLLPKPIIVSVSYKNKPITNFPVDVKTVDNKRIQQNSTNENGTASIWVKASSSKKNNKLIIKPNLINLPAAFRKYIKAKAIVNYEVSQTIPIEFFISITDSKGNKLPRLEKKITRSLNRMGYSSSKNALLRLEGKVSTGNTQKVEGYKGDQFLTESNLDLFLVINNKKIGSLYATGKGLSSRSKKQSIESSIKKIRIKKREFVNLLTDVEEELKNFLETKSAKFLDKGKILYKQNKLTGAIEQLAKVTHGENQIQEATNLANSIRIQLNKIEEARIQRKIAENEKQRKAKLEQIRIQAETERLKIESDERIAVSKNKTKQMEIQSEEKIAISNNKTEQMKIENENSITTKKETEQNLVNGDWVYPSKDNPTGKSQTIPSGKYSGSQKMGSASGTASLVINGSSCSYSYDMGRYGSATEKGKLIKEGGEVKLDCQSSGGGKYPIKYYSNDNKIVISGYNSEAVLYLKK